MGLRPAEGIKVPVVRKIRAGRPILATEDIDEHILIDKSFFPAENAFSLKVTGDSMIEAGILDGDYVIVKPQKVIEHREIGVALIGDEATVKRILKEKKKIILRPENRDMKSESYDSAEVMIIGKVIGVIRKV
jgi:repressor LexA